MIPSIRQFEAVNGFTSEIYELLNKANVKQPYHMTNKHHVNTQMQAIVSITSRNNPIRPIFKLPKGGRKLVECLPIISKKIGKFGIAELVQLGCHLSKIQHITFGKKISG